MSDELPVAGATILGNEAQISSEKIALQLLQDPDIIAVRNALRAELANMPRGREGDSADRLDLDILQWTASTIIDEVNYVLRERPAFVLGTDTTPRRWFGHLFPGACKGGDNPDAIYRSTVIDAVQNVADVLHAVQSDAAALASAELADRAAARSLAIARQQLALGDISEVAMLNAEQAWRQAEISLAQARASRYADTVALFQALGGGWWNRHDVAQTPSP